MGFAESIDDEENEDDTKQEGRAAEFKREIAAGDFGDGLYSVKE